MASRPEAKEFKVRLADPQDKLINVMRFKHPHKCEIDKLVEPVLHRQEVPERVETEEEAKKREEWRRKRKFRPRKQNPDDQPWVLREKKKDGAIFYGRKEGGINKSASYYVLRLGQDGDFEALPVNNWYDFVPPVKYNYLKDEEAEARFEKRNKTLNYFSIMVSKRIKESEGGAEEEKGAGSSVIKSEDTDSDDDFSSADSMEDVPKTSSSKKKGGAAAAGNKKKKPKKKKPSSDEIEREAEEESDEGDFESKEVDYSSTSSSEDNQERIKAVKEEPRDDAEVERKEERDIDKVFEESSSGEGEEDELTESGKALKALIHKHDGGGESDSDHQLESGDESLDDSKMDTSKPSGTGAPGPSKVPTTKEEQQQATVSSPPAKKPKLESPSKITVEEVKKYLARKPMTSKALVKKFVKLKTDLDKGQIVYMLGSLLKSMHQIDKQKIKGKMYLSLRSSD